MTIRPSDSRFAHATDARSVAEALAPRFATALPGADWDRLEVTNALPSGAGEFALQYRLPRGDGHDALIGGHLGTDGAAAPAWTDAPAAGWWPEVGLAVALPAADPRLAVIGPMLDDDSGRLPGWDRPLGRLTVLAYRLGKRCVLRARSAADPVLVKVVRPGRAAPLAAAFDRGIAGRPDATPAVLHTDDERGIVVMEYVAGPTLDRVTGADALAGHRAAGELLRALHAPVHGPATRTARDELDQLDAWAGAAATVFPGLAAEWQVRLDELHRSAPADPVRPAGLHRDFYDKQILLAGDRTVLLDLDTAAAGDPALDLGNHLAHVRLRALQRGGDDRTCADAFLAGYGPAPELLERTGWWRAAALLRLSLIYSLRPRWRALVPRLLEETDACLTD